MTDEYSFEVEFEVPEEVGEENILLVLREFFGDLVETDRFVDARVKEPTTMDDGEQERLVEILEDLSEEDIEQAEKLLEEMRDDGSS